MTASASAATGAAHAVDILERVLRAQLEGWRRALAVIDRQRDALRRADGEELRRATAEQQQITRSLALLDHQRQRLSATLREQVMPGVDHAVPLSQVVQRVARDQAHRDQLMALVDDLRQSMDAAKSRHSVVASAAGALEKHIAGIQQAVFAALNKTRVYGRRGKLALGQAASAAVDMRS